MKLKESKYALNKNGLPKIITSLASLDFTTLNNRYFEHNENDKESNLTSKNGMQSTLLHLEDKLIINDKNIRFPDINRKNGGLSGISSSFDIDKNWKKSRLR